jgi:hypothetical protein
VSATDPFKAEPLSVAQTKTCAFTGTPPAPTVIVTLPLTTVLDDPMLVMLTGNS